MRRTSIECVSLCLFLSASIKMPSERDMSGSGKPCIIVVCDAYERERQLIKAVRKTTPLSFSHLPPHTHTDRTESYIGVTGVFYKRCLVALTPRAKRDRSSHSKKRQNNGLFSQRSLFFLWFIFALLWFLLRNESHQALYVSVRSICGRTIETHRDRKLARPLPLSLSLSLPFLS